MRWLKYMIFMAVLLPALAQAQYRGSGRPLGRQETLDSLAAKPDTSEITRIENMLWHPADSTLVLNLKENFLRNVIQIFGTPEIGLWTDGRWDASGGSHTDDTNNCLTDWQSVEITMSANAEGAHVEKTLDLTHFSSGDTSTTADYIIISVYVDSTADLNYADSLGSATVRVRLFCDAKPAITNYFNFVLSPLAPGWNHFQFTKSSASEAGSPDWNSVDGFGISMYSNPTGTVKVSVDNIQMVRKNPQYPEPLPVQEPGDDSRYALKGNDNFWLVNESGEISLMPGDGLSSYLLLVEDSLANYNLSGITRVGEGGIAYLVAPNGYHTYVYSTLLKVRDSTGTYHNVTLPATITEGDLVHWEVIRRGTSIKVLVSLDGGRVWTAQSTFTFSGLHHLRFYCNEGQRIYAIGGSGSVAYADMAGVALRLKGVFWRGNTIDTLFWPATKVDSFNYIVPTGRVKQ